MIIHFRKWTISFSNFALSTVTDSFHLAYTMDPENRSTAVQLPHFDFDACDGSLLSCKKKTIVLKNNIVVGAPSIQLSTDQQVIERSSQTLPNIIKTDLHFQEQSSDDYNHNTAVNRQLPNKSSLTQNGSNFGDVNNKEKISTVLRQSLHGNESTLPQRQTFTATSNSTFVSKVSSLSASKSAYISGPSNSSTSSINSMKKNIGNVPATEFLQSLSGSSAPSISTSNSLNTSGTTQSFRGSKDVEKAISVFEHVLLLPPSYHKSSKEDSLPSNYLTKEDEAIQARQLWNRHQKRVREKKKRMKRYQQPTKEQSSDDEFEVGRSGRKRKKPKLFSDYVMEKPKQANDQIDVEEEVYDSPDFEISDDDASYSSDDLDEDSSILSSDGESKMSSSSLSDDFGPTTSKQQTHATVGGVRTNSELNWNLQLKALKRFKKVHGHTR